MSHRLRILLLVLLTATACTTGVTVTPRLPAHYEKLGHTTGEGCGVMLFMPILMSSRLERAYANALARRPGATALTSVEMWDSWFFWVLGTTYCTSLEGEAIRETGEPAP